MAGLRELPPFQFPPNVNYSWCETDAQKREVTKFGYVWTIKNFSHFQEASGEFLQSSTFSSSENDENKWSLRLYPRGDTKETAAYVSLFLFHQPASLNIRAGFEFCLLKNNKTKTHIRGITEGCHFRSNWGYPRYIKRNYVMKERKGFLLRDELTICCEVFIVKPKVTTGLYNAKFVEDAGSGRVIDDLGRLLISKNFSDVVLVAEDKELHAHKYIIAARSPVFNAMFQHDMTENRENRVLISDISFTVLEEMVCFLYTGKVPIENEEMLVQLLSAADKYNLEDLTAICDKTLSTKLNAANVMKLIPLASLHNTNHLKARLIEFIKSNTTDGAISELWNLLLSQHPQIVAGTIKSKR